MAVHIRYKTLYISWPSSAQRHESSVLVNANDGG